ncbi:OsmC family protein [Halopiger xanaduensis]|uniref:OsmC family protein n=1 Tax=Halopiger xanaduensis (strain DSM 18323 / JCM 14033 / SH-6) TaxID=797210 RepID=F8D3R3_HALXS|nr:OsmC family protein [Halopiger xanaduensis]AEH37439.1 OsmC family protein [Halopiger xanaduensis SH-6]
MGFLVRIPPLEPTTSDEPTWGTVREWHVDEGDSIAAGDPVAEVEFETAVISVDAAGDGVLRRRLSATGSTAPPGTPIGIVAPAGRDIADLEAAAASDLGGPSADSAFGTRDGTAMPGRTVTASTPDGWCGRIRAGSFAWPYDEPESSGGTETGPTPVDVFLGGLAACLSLSVRYQAEKRDAGIGEISVTADGEPERGSVEQLDVTVRLEADADEIDDDTLERLVELAERGCHVSELLRDDLAFDLSWERL